MKTHSDDKPRMLILFLLSKRRLQSDLIITCKLLYWEIRFGNKIPLNLEDKGTFRSKAGHRNQVNTG